MSEAQIRTMISELSGIIQKLQVQHKKNIKLREIQIEKDQSFINDIEVLIEENKKLTDRIQKLEQINYENKKSTRHYEVKI